MPENESLLMNKPSGSLLQDIDRISLCINTNTQNGAPQIHQNNNLQSWTLHGFEQSDLEKLVWSISPEAALPSGISQPGNIVQDNHQLIQKSTISLNCDDDVKGVQDPGRNIVLLTASSNQNRCLPIFTNNSSGGHHPRSQSIVTASTSSSNSSTPQLTGLPTMLSLSSDLKQARSAAAGTLPPIPPLPDASSLLQHSAPKEESPSPVIVGNASQQLCPLNPLSQPDMNVIYSNFPTNLDSCPISTTPTMPSSSSLTMPSTTCFPASYPPLPPLPDLSSSIQPLLQPFAPFGLPMDSLTALNLLPPVVDPQQAQSLVYPQPILPPITYPDNLGVKSESLLKRPRAKKAPTKLLTTSDISSRNQQPPVDRVEEANNQPSNCSSPPKLSTTTTVAVDSLGYDDDDDSNSGLGQLSPCGKLERKRARNRVAARRCRERKMTLIGALEAQVAERDAEVERLNATLSSYQAEAQRLATVMYQLADSYPSLKSELHRFPLIFKQPPAPPQQHQLSVNGKNLPTVKSSPQSLLMDCLPAGVGPYSINPSKC